MSTFSPLFSFAHHAKGLRNSFLATRQVYPRSADRTRSRSAENTYSLTKITRHVSYSALFQRWCSSKWSKKAHTFAVTISDHAQNALVGRGSSYTHNELIQSSFGRLGLDGTSKAITIDHSSNGVSFEVFNGAETRPMLSSSTNRLPEWNCMDTNFTAVSAMAPNVRDRDVKVFLKKRKGPWSAPSSLEIRVSAIVHRDISTTRAPKAVRLLLAYFSKLDKQQNGVGHVAWGEATIFINPIDKMREECVMREGISPTIAIPWTSDHEDERKGMYIITFITSFFDIPFF